MRDILNLVSKLHYISTKDTNVFNEIKEIISGAAAMLESSGKDD